MTNTTTITRTNPIRRSEHDPGPAWPDVIRRLKIDALAGERHASRIRAAEWALASTYRPGDDPDMIVLDEHDIKVLRTIAALELHGEGGLGGYSGGSTSRMSWASGLGSGRHQAGDGPAWDRAIEGVFGGVPPCPTPTDVALVAYDYLTGPDLAWSIAYAIHRAADSVLPEDGARWLNVAARCLYEMTASERGAWVDAMSCQWAVDLLGMVEGLPAMSAEATVSEYLDRVLPVAPADDTGPMVEIVSRRGA